jgi:putative transposase
MSSYRRPPVTGATVFFTVALAQRGSDLLRGEVALLRQAVRQTKAERPFDIEAWVVLPDHLHCVLTLPAGDAGYPTRWRLIKTRFSRQLPVGPLRPSHIRRGERGIWQRRYWEHHIRDSADFAAHVRYCWTNPVKHGFVGSPEEWPYSSIHRDIAHGEYDPKNGGHFLIP